MSVGLIFLLNSFFKRFLKDKGLLFHIFAPIREKEFAWMDSKHLVTGPEGNSEFCFPRISRETLRFSGNEIHCFPRDQSLSDLLYSKTKQNKTKF